MKVTLTLVLSNILTQTGVNVVDKGGFFFINMNLIFIKKYFKN